MPVVFLFFLPFCIQASFWLYVTIAPLSVLKNVMASRNPRCSRAMFSGVSS